MAGIRLTGGPVPIGTAEAGNYSDRHMHSSMAETQYRQTLATVPAGPTVPAKVCRAGHPNDPDADRCWICHDRFDPAAQLVHRSPGVLARLLFEDGTAVAVADDILIGRCPPADGALATVAITGPQVSRRHLMVRIQGWRLYVSDCESTNGTFLTRPGDRGRRRIPAGGGVALRIGDLLHFGSRQARVARPTVG